MKCNKCSVENPDGAKFCRSCGNILPDVGTVMELYPEYNLIPTTIFKLKPYMMYTIFFVLFSILYLFFALYAFVGGISMFVYEQWHGHNEECYLFLGVGGLIALIIYYAIWLKKEYLLSPNHYRKRKKRLFEYDYIQSYTSRREQYVFIVKNQQFGLYDVKRIKIQLMPDYELLSWKTKGEILNATKNGRQFLIDVYGNELR